MSFNVLPVECISLILAFTSPKDASRLAAVSPSFRSAADSDSLWQSFLPFDYQELISQSSSSSFSPLYLNSLSKKALFFHLCDHPLLISNRNSSFTLEKWSGRKCYMIGARDLEITWGNDSRYWTWKSLPETRFSEVAELEHVWWFDIKGKIEARKLSPKTTYTGYFVFKFKEAENRYGNGFDRRPVLFRVYFEGAEVEEGKMVVLDPPEGTPRPFQDRLDGWKEIEIGEIYNELGDDGSIVFSVKHVINVVKSGIIVEGIEIRPKTG